MRRSHFLLSSITPKVLIWTRIGRIGNCRISIKNTTTFSGCILCYAVIKLNFCVQPQSKSRSRNRSNYAAFTLFVKLYYAESTDSDTNREDRELPDFKNKNNCFMRLFLLHIENFAMVAWFKRGLPINLENKIPIV